MLLIHMYRDKKAVLVQGVRRDLMENRWDEAVEFHTYGIVTFHDSVLSYC